MPATFLLEGVATGTGTGVALNCVPNHYSIYVYFSADTTAGVVEIETADNPSFTGTWANYATVTWAAGDAQQHVAIIAPLLAIRARISTTISGGADPYVTVRLAMARPS